VKATIKDSVLQPVDDSVVLQSVHKSNNMPSDVENIKPDNKEDTPEHMLVHNPCTSVKNVNEITKNAHMNPTVTLPEKATEYENMVDCNEQLKSVHADNVGGTTLSGSEKAVCYISCKISVSLYLLITNVGNQT
jgi:uncharacterized protein YccT (UPF0319 family)